MSEAQATEPAAGQAACEICGQPGSAVVCACDGVDLICHLENCDTVCAKCRARATGAVAAASKDKPAPRDVAQPCILEVRKECSGRGADVATARKAYQVLGIDRHNRDTFAADVLLGSFEAVRFSGEAEIGDDDNLRHLTRCWTCSPPRPSSAKQWCVHPREIWKLREGKPDAPDIRTVADQIRVLEQMREPLLKAVSTPARGMGQRRLQNMIDIASEVGP